MGKKTTGSTPATQVLHRFSISFCEHHFTHDPAAHSFGQEAAHALGSPPEQVFKTLVFAVTGLRAHQGLAVGVVPASGSLHLKSAAAALGYKKATMATPAQAERASGYVTGGVSPFGQRTRLPTLADSSIEGWDSIYVSGGRRGFILSLAPADLVRACDALVAPIAEGAP